jgi:hypothetical protein
MPTIQVRLSNLPSDLKNYKPNANASPDPSDWRFGLMAVPITFMQTFSDRVHDVHFGTSAL